ncbi:molecular chaperone [Acinetobacter sp. C26M]|uniref:fimbrial biogenesis chaperone n=1 Tax=unclassified Acinetobacter TaxID=196816 RepID=UPI0020368C7E|nr:MULTISPECIES: molecular chaperone [unclassified Acinetobacter]USA47469.1 molecular chaperone [Acinetobacter sp. C26M]USA50950.1 molecular chaperone [Acinetobacter sp. C26G]
MRNPNFVLGLFIFFFGMNLYAGLVTSSSRVIYHEGEREKSFVIANINEYPIVVQTWFDDGSGDPEQANAPFIILPAIFRMQPEGIQPLRIFYTGSALPDDRESVFWLNLYEVPGIKKDTIKENQAKLDFAMNTQLKIFYRPKRLRKIEAHEIIKKLKFELKSENNQVFLVCENSSPYHISFSGLKVFAQGQEINAKQEMDMMTNPLSKRNYILERNVNSFDKIEFYIIGDDGNTYTGEFGGQGVIKSVI